MAAKTKTKATRSTALPTIVGTVEEIPSPQNVSPVRELVAAILENGSEVWTELDPGEREVGSIQSSLTGAAQRMGVKIQTRIRPNDSGKDVVFVRKAPEETEETEG